jgi:hypothetical protein
MFDEYRGQLVFLIPSNMFSKVPPFGLASTLHSQASATIVTILIISPSGGAGV